MDILAFLFLASIVGLLVGRKRPEWVRLASRKQATWVFGALACVFALLFSVFSDVEPTEQAAPVVQAEPRTEETAGVPEASTAEDRVLAEGEVQPEETRTAEVAASNTDADVGAVGEGAPAVVAPRASAVAQPMTAGGEVFDVESVVDGDTIKVSMNGKVETLRLIGIDTPETKDPRKPVQCFGAEASRKATELLAGQKVRLEADASQGERDKYGRLLRYVWRGWAVLQRLDDPERVRLRVHLQYALPVPSNLQGGATSCGGQGSRLVESIDVRRRGERGGDHETVSRAGGASGCGRGRAYLLHVEPLLGEVLLLRYRPRMEVALDGELTVVLV